jgi:hypothetical protein
VSAFNQRSPRRSPTPFSAFGIRASLFRVPSTRTTRFILLAYLESAASRNWQKLR